MIGIVSRHKPHHQWASCNDCPWVQISVGHFGPGRKARHHVRRTGHEVEVVTQTSILVHQKQF